MYDPHAETVEDFWPGPWDEDRERIPVSTAALQLIDERAIDYRDFLRSFIKSLSYDNNDIREMFESKVAKILQMDDITVSTTFEVYTDFVTVTIADTKGNSVEFGYRSTDLVVVDLNYVNAIATTFRWNQPVLPLTNEEEKGLETWYDEGLPF